MSSPRPDGVTSASLVDALGRIHVHRAHLLDLVSPDPTRVLFGPAAIVTYVPVRKDDAAGPAKSFGRLFYEAVGDEPKGKVLVLASSGHPDASIGGGTKLSRLHNHDMAGVLTDGRLRDFHELRDYQFATYCNGETTRWGGDVIMPWGANEPAVLHDRRGGAVTVLPGDYVYADQAGAVIIPGADIDRVLDDARRIEAEDAEWIERIRSEKPEEVRKGGSAET